MVGTPARSGQLLLTTGSTARSPSARPGLECCRERAPRSAEGSGHIRLCRRTTQRRRSGSGSVKISSTGFDNLLIHAIEPAIAATSAPVWTEHEATDIARVDQNRAGTPGGTRASADRRLQARTAARTAQDRPRTDPDAIPGRRLVSVLATETAGSSGTVVSTTSPVTTAPQVRQANTTPQPMIASRRRVAEASHPKVLGAPCVRQVQGSR